MSFLKAPLFVLSTIAALVAISACATEPKVTELSDTANPQAELDRVQQNLGASMQAQVNVLAPKDFQLAMDAWNKASNDRNSSKDQKEVLHEIALSQSYLDKANSVAEISTHLLQAPIQARKEALVAKADRLLPDEMTKADKDFRSLTKKIENNDTSVDSEKVKALSQSYQDIELKAIQTDKLGEAEAALKEAKSEGAKKLTPDALMQTEKSMVADRASIAGHRHDAGIIAQASADADSSTNRLLQMVRDAKGSKDMSPEQLAARKQALEAKNAKGEVDRNETQEALSKTQNQLAQASNANDGLASQVAMERKFNSARQEFNSNEADVYQQGNRFLIRLKGLSFKNNRADIAAGDFPLLAKVQKVITEFGTGTVAIEGNTDSTGSQATNAQLSTARAQSVQSYLVSNKAVDPAKITATGFGDSKPIGNNKTAAGRSQNRRVDVIIDVAPQVQSAM